MSVGVTSPLPVLHSCNGLPPLRGEAEADLRAQTPQSCPPTWNAGAPPGRAEEAHPSPPASVSLPGAAGARRGLGTACALR